MPSKLKAHPKKHTNEINFPIPLDTFDIEIRSQLQKLPTTDVDEANERHANFINPSQFQS